MRIECEGLSDIWLNYSYLSVSLHSRTFLKNLSLTMLFVGTDKY